MKICENIEWTSEQFTCKQGWGSTQHDDALSDSEQLTNRFALQKVSTATWFSA